MKLDTPIGEAIVHPSDQVNLRPSAASEKDGESARQGRAEKTMIRVRWAGVVFGVVQVFTFYIPYPKGMFALAMGMVALLAVGNLAVWAASKRVANLNQALRLSITSLGLDVVVILGLTFVYTFDPNTAIWALVYILPLEGAIRFGHRGAIWTMTAATILYASREFYGQAFFGIEVLPTSISFRMGIGFIVAAVAGSMARNLTRDRKDLQKANATYGSMLDAISQLGQGCLIVQDGQVIYSNEAIERILGFEPGGLARVEDVLSMLDEDQEDRAMALLAPVPGADADADAGGSFEAKGRRKDGSAMCLEIAYKPMESGDGRIVVLVGDVTERSLAGAALEASQLQLSEAQQIARIGSWSWDISQDKVSWSDEMFRLFGLKPQSEVISFKKFIGLVHTGERPAVEAAVRESFETSRPFSFEHRVNLPGGVERVLAARGQPTLDDDGNVVGMVGTGQDVTERKRSKTALEDALEREREAVKGLQQMDEIKSDFLSTVSHELRTPVTTIGGFASTLLSNWARLGDDNREDFLRRIHSGANQLQKLISELLDFSTLERSHLEKVEMSERNLKDEVTRVLDGISPLFDKKTVVTEVPSDLIVLCNPEAIERVLENLLTNAIKFSPNHSTITVKAWARDHHEAIVEVHDEGMGIPPAEMQKVFDRFYRVNRGDTAPSGTGIGLAVVKQFVEAQGGRVWVRARPGGGTIFSFSIKRPGLVQGTRDSSASLLPR